MYGQMEHDVFERHCSSPHGPPPDSHMRLQVELGTPVDNVAEDAR
jgi:hypothetical protein